LQECLVREAGRKVKPGTFLRHNSLEVVVYRRI
jgi:hypothetical protein